MREERLLSYLKGACPGRKYRVSGTEPEKAIAGLEAALETFGEAGDDRDAGFPTRAQRSGSCGERRSDEASELLPQDGSERAESATT